MTDSPEKMGVPDELLTKMGLPTRDEMEDWLNDNNTDFAPEASVTLHSFDVVWSDFRGRCQARSDSQLRSPSTTIVSHGPYGGDQLCIHLWACQLPSQRLTFLSLLPK